MLMPEGNYQGTLIAEECQFAEASTGTLQIVLPFRVATESGPVKRTIFLSLTDRTMGRDEDGKPRIAQQALDELGYNGDDPPTFANGENPVELYCKHEINNKNETSEKWNISGGMNLKEPPRDRVQRFLSDWRALTGGTGKPKPSNGGGRPAPAQRPTGGRPAGRPGRGADLLVKSGGKEGGDEAWEVWAKNTQGGSTKIDPKEWEKVVSEREQEVGRGEQDFTAEDWDAVARVKHIPI